MMRRGFSLIEVLMVAVILTVIAGVAVPAYRRYQLRSDLDIVAQQLQQAVNRAQVLSQAGQDGSSWGVALGSGVLYKGTSYALRDAAFDEAYPFPDTVRATGLKEVSFSRVEGRPSATGTVLLVTLARDTRTISITISTEGIAVDETDTLTVCHQTGGSCETKQINDNAWNGHEEHNDYLGICRDRDNDGDECDDD